MAEREPGPYWVRDRFDDEWVVALWSSGPLGDEWLLHGDIKGYRDADFIEIGPRAELPPPVIVETTSADSAPTVAHYDTNTPEGKRALAAFLRLPVRLVDADISDRELADQRHPVTDAEGLADLIAEVREAERAKIEAELTERFLRCGALPTTATTVPHQWSDEG